MSSLDRLRSEGLSSPEARTQAELWWDDHVKFASETLDYGDSETPSAGHSRILHFSNAAECPCNSQQKRELQTFAVDADCMAADPTSNFTIAQDNAARTAGCEACEMSTMKSCYKHEGKRPAATCILWRRAAKPVGTRANAARCRRRSGRLYNLSK